MIAGAATYPEWVVKAREQLDAVCGHNAERLPQWSDEDNLPYITAAVKESFRLALAIALLMPQMASQYRTVGRSDNVD